MSKTTQVVMAHAVAARWINRVARTEHRIRICYNTAEYRNLPNLLRSFRDNKVKIAGVLPIPDLGVKEDFDALEVWSSDWNALNSLGKWAEDKGFETSGVW